MVEPEIGHHESSRSQLSFFAFWAIKKGAPFFHLAFGLRLGFPWARHNFDMGRVTSSDVPSPLM